MIRNILKDSVIYGISKYLGVFAAIFLMPIYTRLLSKSDYGIMEIVNSWNNLIIILLPLGLTSSIIRYYPDVKDSVSKKRRFIGTTLTTILSMSLGYVAIMLLIKPWMIKIFGDYDEIDEVYYHSLFIGVAAIVFAFFLTVLQAQLRKVPYLIASITNLLILVSLGFIFVYYNKMGIVGFYRASSIAYGAAILIALMFTFKDVTINFSKRTLKVVMGYSVHILSVGLLFHAVNLLDRYIIVHYNDLSEVGIYSIGVRISSIMGLAISSFALAWFPLSMRIKDDENAVSIYKRVHNFYFISVTILLSGLILMRKELLEIFAPTYEGSFNIIAILGAYIIINGSIYFYSLGIHIRKKTKYFTYSALLSVLINVISSILLLKIIGIDGVAVGTLLGAIVWVSFQYYYSNRLYPISYNLRYILLSLVTVGSILLASDFLIDPNLDGSLIVRIILKVVFTTVLGVVLIFSFMGKRNFLNSIDVFKNLKK